MKRSINILKTILFNWGITLVLSGCDAFLDEVPDNRVALDDLDKAAQLLTNAYSAASPAFTDIMTDDISYTIGTTIRQNQQQLYAWSDVTTGPDEQDSPEFYWNETYNAISHANEVLAVIDNLPANSEEDITRRDAIKAEALITRAYGHFMLVNYFGKQYDSQTSGADPGIPYIKTPETVFIGKYERVSVKRVYDLVEDDLLDGLELVNDNFYSNSGKYHFNRNATLAFASRYYLFKRDFIRCLQYSNQLLGNNPGAFIRDLTSTEFRNAKGSISLFPQLYCSPDEQSNLLLMRKISLVQRTDFGHGIERNYYSDLFDFNIFTGSTDERENPALVKGENALMPLRYESLFQRSSLNSNTGLPYHIAIIFRGEEVLFNRIESNIYLNNVSKAIEDLQAFVERRFRGDDIVITMPRLRAAFGATNEPSFTDQDILLNYILVERDKEFLTQGMRWFDIKRYGIQVTHNFPGGQDVLESDDPRKVLQIPKSAIDVGGLEPNER